MKYRNWYQNLTRLQQFGQVQYKAKLQCAFKDRFSWIEWICWSATVLINNDSHTNLFVCLWRIICATFLSNPNINLLSLTKTILTTQWKVSLHFKLLKSQCPSVHTAGWLTSLSSRSIVIVVVFSSVTVSKLLLKVTCPQLVIAYRMCQSLIKTLKIIVLKKVFSLRHIFCLVVEKQFGQEFWALYCFVELLPKTTQLSSFNLVLLGTFEKVIKANKLKISKRLLTMHVFHMFEKLPFGLEIWSINCSSSGRRGRTFLALFFSVFCKIKKII